MEDCICLYIDESPAELHTSVDRTAKKEHKCCECGRPILPGEKYEYVKGKWEGEFTQFKTCWICKTIREDFFNCGFYYGQLWEDLYDAFAEYGEDNDWICP